MQVPDQRVQEALRGFRRGRTGESEGGNTVNGGPGKTCNFCGVKGHKETQCFKKNPKKAPG